MSWNERIRWLHRWVSIVFTLAVIANFVAMAVAPQTVWVGFVALVPLLVLLPTGLWLFALPYLAKRRTKRLD